MGKAKKYAWLKQYFVTLYVILSSLRTLKFFTKFYASYKSSINYSKNSIIKDKIKIDEHFDSTFTLNE